MADTTLNIAELNPLKFYSDTLKYPDNYRSRFMDDFSFQNQIRNFEYRVKYFQKWMYDDTIHLQFETDYTDIKLEIVDDCTDVVIKTITPATVSSQINNAPLVFKNVSVKVNDLDGIYYARIKVGVQGTFKYYSSEPFEVSQLVENSVLLHYSNVENDYDVAFDTGIVFQFRVEGGLTEFRPGSKRKIYEDQNLNSVRLSATPFRTNKLVIAGAEGVPDWVPDLVNRIYCCDYTTVDGKQFVRLDGDMEAKREENYPMAGWSFDIREAQNRHTKQFNVKVLFGILDYDGAVLIDYDNSVLEYK